MQPSGPTGGAAAAGSSDDHFTYALAVDNTRRCDLCKQIILPGAKMFNLGEEDIDLCHRYDELGMFAVQC